MYHVKMLFQLVLRNNIWKLGHFNNGSNSTQKPAAFPGGIGKKAGLASAPAVQEQPKSSTISRFWNSDMQEGHFPAKDSVVSLEARTKLPLSLSLLFAISVWYRMCSVPLQLIRVWERGKPSSCGHRALSCHSASSSFADHLSKRGD